MGKSERELLEGIQDELRYANDKQLEREWEARRLRGDIPVPVFRKGGPLTENPQLKALRPFTTGWHFLPLALALLLLLRELSSRVHFHGVDLTVIAPTATGLVAVLLALLFALTARRHRVPLRWAERRRLGRRLSPAERRTSYGLWQPALAATRSTAYVAAGVGLFTVLGDANHLGTWLLGFVAVLSGGLGITPLFNGMWSFRAVISDKPESLRDGY